jgi:hypothetical protein
MAKTVNNSTRVKAVCFVEDGFIKKGFGGGVFFMIQLLRLRKRTRRVVPLRMREPVEGSGTRVALTVTPYVGNELGPVSTD